jgi:PAS domain-containing protein
MVVATSTTAIAVSLAALVASGGFVGAIFGYRENPTTRPLIGVAVALLVGAFAHLAVVDLVPVRAVLGLPGGPTDTTGGLWLLVAFDISTVVGVLWFLFALQYTGRDERTSSIAYFAAAGVLLLLLGPHFMLTLSGSYVGFESQTPNLLLGVAVVLAEALALIGIFLVLDVTFQHKAFPLAQAALFTGAVGLVLLVPFVATTVRNPITTPLLLAGSAVLFTGVLYRHRPFETLPVVSLVGRDRVFEEMSDGVVIVGSDGHIRDLNPAAQRLFEVDRASAVDQPLATVAPAIPDLSISGGDSPTDVALETGRTVSVSVEEICDHRSRGLGWSLVCRDITAKRRRTKRLSVLTRAIAGVTTGQMQTVTSVTGAIDSGDCDPERGGDRIRATATDVATLVACVRDIESALSSSEESQHTHLDLRETLDSLSTDGKFDTVVEAGPRSPVAAADPELVTATLTTLLAGTESPTVTVSTDPDRVTVDISPFDPSGENSLQALSFQIANTAAESASWDLTTVQESRTHGVRLRFRPGPACSAPDGDIE